MNKDQNMMATYDLIEVGLAMIERGVGWTSEAAVNAWLMADDDAPFPEPDISEG